MVDHARRHAQFNRGGDSQRAKRHIVQTDDVNLHVAQAGQIAWRRWPASAQGPVQSGGLKAVFHAAHTAQQLEEVYQNIGSQIGYTIHQQDVSWRFLAAGFLIMLAAAAASPLWAGRLA